MGQFQDYFYLHERSLIVPPQSRASRPGHVAVVLGIPQPLGRAPLGSNRVPVEGLVLQDLFPLPEDSKHEGTRTR